jgi:hypothetical protein
MKQWKVKEKDVLDLKEYFEKSAFTFMYRKTVNQIQSVFPHLCDRQIRKAMKVLKQEFKMQITPGGRGRKGYFLVDQNNEYDRHLGWIHYCDLKSRESQNRKTAKTFKNLKPSNQLKLAV